MQPHEGPPSNPEQERQRRLTIQLVGAIIALLGILIVAYVQRYR
jgi:predicted nucleic acid-binding Zn ribbon protein